MIYPSILDRKYEEYRPLVKEVAGRVKQTLTNFCEDHGYAFMSRIKSVESLAEKIETGRFKAWVDLDDLFACTVIVPTLSNENKVIEFCKNTFDTSNLRFVKRGQNKKAPDSFKFDSTRIYARLKKSDETIPDNILSIYSVVFEIQVKSAFEHAWSVSTHDLVYKSSEIDWRRLRLAAQIKATVEQLDTLILSFEQISNIIDNNNYAEIKIKNRLAKEIKKLFENGRLPDELRPKDMNRLCNNLCLILDERQDKNLNEIDIMKQIKKEIECKPIKEIPLSLSLFQYFFVILIHSQVIKLPLNNYYCHITEELTTLYPDICTNEEHIFLY
jgi:ppGpp synthetase/RelA/SpoT-type nucleotidyltranferase